MRIRRVTALLCAAALTLAGCGVNAANQSAGSQTNSDVIHFDWGIPTGAYIPLYVAQEQGLFKKHGLDPQFHTFTTGAPLLAGLKSGSLDVVTTGLATVFALGQGIPLTYLTWMGDAAAAEGIVSAPGSGIQTINDLDKGTIAAPTGTCAQISLYYAAKQAGLDYSDLNIKNIAPNLYSNAFKSGAIDAGVAWSPYMISLLEQGKHLVGWDAEWVPHGGACPEMTVARPDVLEQHPQLASRLIAVHAEAVQMVMNNPELGVDALAEELSLSHDVAQRTFERYFQDYPTYEKQLDPTSRYSLVSENGLLAQLEVASTALAKLGVIPEPVPTSTLKKAIDPQYVRAYVKNHQQGD